MFRFQSILLVLGTLLCFVGCGNSSPDKSAVDNESGVAITPEVLATMPTQPVELVSAQSSKCIDDTAWSTTNGTLLQQYTCESSQANQLWKLVPVGSNYQIVSDYSGKCMGQGASTLNGAQIQQWDCLGTSKTSQLWRLVPMSSGYQIISVYSGKCVGNGNSLTNGTKLQQWTCLGSSQTSQIWKVVAPASSQTATACGPIHLGYNGSLGGVRPYPSDNIWNQNISAAAVDPNSSNIISYISATNPVLHPDFGYSGGFPYIVVGPTQPNVTVTYTEYGGDPGPFPIPSNAPIEGGSSSTGDRHVLVVQCNANSSSNYLTADFELFHAYLNSNGSWNAGSGGKYLFNDVQRLPGAGKADASGIPIFPGLIRYDEVVSGSINHALIFTVDRSRNAYVAPAYASASSNTSTSAPPMGMHVRLKASYNISGFSKTNQIILTALKQYGMFVYDNGTSWHIQGTPDTRWSDDDLHALTTIPGSAFEVIKMGTIE